MFELVVVDLRDPVVAGRVRVNVSRRVHASAFAHERALGNPFTVARSEPFGAASARFRRFLWVRLQSGECAESDALDRIRDLAQRQEVELGCWCRGADTCHAHVVASAVRWLDGDFSTTEEV